MLNHSDPNLLATLVAAELGSFPQVLRGTVVVTGGVDGEGNTLPLSEQDLRLLETIVDRVRMPCTNAFHGQLWTQVMRHNGRAGVSESGALVDRAPCGCLVLVSRGDNRVKEEGVPASVPTGVHEPDVRERPLIPKYR